MAPPTLRFTRVPGDLRVLTARPLPTEIKGGPGHDATHCTLCFWSSLSHLLRRRLPAALLLDDKVHASAVHHVCFQLEQSPVAVSLTPPSMTARFGSRPPSFPFVSHCKPLSTRNPLRVPACHAIPTTGGRGVVWGPRLPAHPWCIPMVWADGVVR
ncbi:hypothetical protein LZ31DRAFT_140722 [Colletotrichum somersetense]|nr:hypothetical protein LZ31DRAFT_140722 [Colletotrichum somersetense]